MGNCVSARERPLHGLPAPHCDLTAMATVATVAAVVIVLRRSRLLRWRSLVLVAMVE